MTLAFLNTELISYFNYLFGSLLIASSIGILCVRRMGLYNIPVSASFLIGFSLTPFVIGGITMLMSFIPVTLPFPFYILPPYILSFIILVSERKWIRQTVKKFSFSCFVTIPTFLLIAFATYLYFKDIYPALPMCSLSFLYGDSIVQQAIRIALFIIGLLPLCILTVRLFIKVRQGKQIARFKEIVSYIFQKTRQLNGRISISMLCKFISDDEAEPEEKTFHICNVRIHRFPVLVLLVIICFAIAVLSTIFIFNLFTAYLPNINEAVKSICMLQLGFPAPFNYFVYALLVGILFIGFLYIAWRIIFNRHQNVFDISRIIYYTLAIMAVITVFSILRETVISSASPVIGSDASQYLSIAYRFAGSMQFKDITLFAGDISGALVPMTHHPAWICYLANAMHHSISGNIGFPFDFAVRLSIQMTYLYMFTAIAAFARIFSRRGVIFLAITLPLIMSGFEYIYTSASRDCFRIIPLVLLAFVLLKGEVVLDRKPLQWKYLLLCLFIGSTVMMGHIINAFMALIIVLAHTLYTVIRKKLNIGMITMYIATGTGAVLGSFQVLWAYIKTGSFSGNMYDLDVLLENTPYIDNYLVYQGNRLQGASTLLGRLKIILERDNGIISISACILSIIFIAVYLFRCHKRRQKPAPILFLALISVFSILYVIGPIKWSGATLSEWCVMNFRYTLHLYVFWGIFLAVVIGSIQYNLQKVKQKIILWVCVVAVGLLPYTIFSEKYSKSKLNSLSGQFYSNSLLVEEYLQALYLTSSVNGNILVDNYYCNYYLRNMAITLFSTRSDSIRRARTIEELDLALRQQGIRILLLTSGLKDVYWKNTVLEEYVDNRAYTQVIDENGEMLLYTIIDKQ